MFANALNAHKNITINFTKYKMINENTQFAKINIQHNFICVRCERKKKETQSHLKKSFDHTFRNKKRNDISTNRDSATSTSRHFDDIAKRNANSIKQSFRGFKKRKFFAIDSIRFHFDEF